MAQAEKGHGRRHGGDISRVDGVTVAARSRQIGDGSVADVERSKHGGGNVATWSRHRGDDTTAKDGRR
ncbi:hypothetical protein SESBI_09397 [Sesbania bispinosa]|nr:hypothetical protein SESBI_09397 [Sesbania bispinosa]